MFKRAVMTYVPRVRTTCGAKSVMLALSIVYGVYRDWNLVSGEEPKTYGEV